MNNKMLHMVAYVLLWVGGLNWGLVGLLHLNVVEMVLGVGMLTNLVYILVGLSAVYVLLTHKADCRVCGKK
jgi:uncharacterized membrane protein YuzA (DUF378 family)